MFHPRSHAEVEAFVLDLVNRIRDGEPVEDSRLELKRQYPDLGNKKKIHGHARRLAGLANAARGENVL